MKQAFYRKRAVKVTVNGVDYRSKYEATIAEKLRKMKFKPEYEAEVVTYTQPAKVRKYTPDFKLTMSDGSVLFIETKGRFTVADRIKMLKVHACNPGLKLLMLFENSKIKIRKASEVSYGDWCTKHGIAWADQSEFNALSGKRGFNSWIKSKLTTATLS